jgi:hypothetical protein
MTSQQRLSAEDRLSLWPTSPGRKTPVPECPRRQELLQRQPRKPGCCGRLSAVHHRVLQPVHILRRVEYGGGMATSPHTDDFHLPVQQSLVPRYIPPSLGGIVVSTQGHGSPIPRMEGLDSITAAVNF